MLTRLRCVPVEQEIDEECLCPRAPDTFDRLPSRGETESAEEADIKQGLECWRVHQSGLCGDWSLMIPPESERCQHRDDARDPEVFGR